MTDDILTEFNETVQEHVNFDLDKFDDYFAYKDQLLEKGFQPIKPLRFLRACATEAVKEEIQYYHGLLMPSPKNLVANSQSNALSEAQQDTASDIIDEYTALLTKSRKVSLEPSTNKEVKFLNEVLKAWETTKEQKREVLDAVDDHWEEQRNE